MPLLIQELDSSYQGKQISFPYQSSHYYDLQRIEENGVLHFKLQKKPFEQPLHKQFETELLQKFLSRHRLFAALLDGQIAGYLETALEDWNNRLRICNIVVDPAYRQQGIGSHLLHFAKQMAQQDKHRAIVLETQSNNGTAISFYQANGFSISGFDTVHYSNQDIANREFRVEMAFLLTSLS